MVLSTGCIFEQPSRKIENAGDGLRADHDWTSAQVARYPGRLIGFCGLNPLKDYALNELARCAKDPDLRNGLKLHFGKSVVDYHNPQHIEQVKGVFRAANGYRMPIVVHMSSCPPPGTPTRRSRSSSRRSAAKIASRIRRLGVQRVLFGSDATGGALTPRMTWEAFRKLPLTEAEFRTIAANVPPYLR